MAGYRLIFGPYTNNGTILTGTEVELYHYASGTSDDKDVYTDLALTTAAAQPLVADSHGLITCFADGGELYKFVIKSAAGATLETFDQTTIGYGLPSTVVNITSPTTGYSVLYSGSAWIQQKPSLWQEPIMNGGMQVAQRGTSFATIADGTYSLDRWIYQKSGAMVHTVTQDTSAPTLANLGCYHATSLKMDVTTADASIGAGDYCLMTQRIRGYRARAIFSQAWTLSFWVKAAKTGTHCVSIANSGTDRCFVSEYTISVADTWEKKTIAVSAFDITSAGTWNTTTGVGYAIRWCLTTGTTYHTSTVDAWQTGNYFGTANQVNETDDTANNLFLTAVQIDLGAVALPFRNIPFQADLEDCQAACQKSFVYATAPGTATGDGKRVFKANGTSDVVTLHWPVRMWAAPTVTLYSTSTGASGKWRDETAAGDLTVTASSQSETGTAVAVTSSVDGNQVGGQWLAEAEI